jgi:putative copper resistance protein D
VTAPTLPALLVSHWQLDATVAATTTVLAILYLTAAIRLRPRWPLRRTTAFLAGLACVVVALDSGLAAYDDRLLSVHMVQHMLLLLAAPPLVLLGRPLILALRVLRGESRRRLARALERLRPLTRPWWCLGAFAAVVLLTHLAGFYDATLRHPALHVAEHALYLAAGGLLWWPLLDGDPVLSHRLGGLGRLVYLLIGMLPMALIGAYLDRHTTVVYTPYAAAARGLGISALGDQATGGAIMWVVGNTLMVLVGLWAVMAALGDEERRQQAREAYARAPVARAPDREGA